MKIKLMIFKTIKDAHYFSNSSHSFFILTKVNYAGNRGDVHVFDACQLIPNVGERQIVVHKIRAYRQFVNYRFPMSPTFYIPFKSFHTMKTTLC